MTIHNFYANLYMNFLIFYKCHLVVKLQSQTNLYREQKQIHRKVTVFLGDFYSIS